MPRICRTNLLCRRPCRQPALRGRCRRSALSSAMPRRAPPSRYTTTVWFHYQPILVFNQHIAAIRQPRFMTVSPGRQPGVGIASRFMRAIALLLTMQVHGSIAQFTYKFHQEQLSYRVLKRFGLVYVHRRHYRGVCVSRDSPRPKISSACPD